MNSILNDIKEEKIPKGVKEFVIDLGISKLPSILRDNTDRNRTSPFAFTGSRFEFRAIGSSASVSLANAFLNGAAAESMEVLISEIEENISEGMGLNESVLNILKKYIIETESIRFEGNNYSQEWAKEAEKRGLPNIKRTAQALNALIDQKNVNMLSHQKIFSQEELESHYYTKIEQYVKTLEIEADTFCEIINTKIFPSALHYQERLLQVIQGFQVLREPLVMEIPKFELELHKCITKKMESLQVGCLKIRKQVKKGIAIEDLSKRADHFADQIVDLLEEVRKPADELEALVDDALWPMPKYTEMLFVI